RPLDLLSLMHLFFLTLPRPPRSPLFPYTTLFRSEISASVAKDRQTTSSAWLHEDIDEARMRLGEELLELEFFVDAARLYGELAADRKSTRLNSSHVKISYAVFCLKKKIKRLTQGLHGTGVIYLDFKIYV